jgi:hypothetical protein
LDIAPEFKVLEIEGDTIPVMASREQVIAEQDQEAVIRVILLRLTQAQFLSLQKLLRRNELFVRRIGVDEKPLIVRPGGLGIFWSRHKEDGETFYKQIVRLIHPSNFPSSKAPGIALATEQNILFRMVMEFSARFERLTDELVDAGAISSEKRALLFSDNWNELLDEQRTTAIKWETYRVADAQEEFAQEI